MSCNWTTQKLADLCDEITVGFVGSMTKEYVDKGIPFFRSKNISEYEVNWDDIKYVSPEFHKKLKKSALSPGDVAIVRTGKPGTCCVIPENIKEANCSDIVIVRVDKAKLCPNYLSFFMNSMANHQVSSRLVGAVQQHFNVSAAKQIEIPLPTLNEQKDIVHVLKTISDKIFINTQTNQTLEQMAQAIFKSWFVDFDPVKAKMNGEQPEGMDAATASLFPEKLVETDMGEIPEGWHLVPVGKLLSKTIGGDWGKEEPDAKHTEEVRIVRGTDIPKLHGGAIESVPVRYVEAKKLKTRKLERGDIVIEVSGGSKDQPTGRSLFISDNILKRLELPSEPASFCRRFQPVNYEVGLLLAVHFQLMYKAGKTWEYQNQSTGISNFQTTYFLEAEHVVVPSQEVLDAFVKQVAPMMDMIHSNQNIELAKLRDTLLPKLLSGEIELGQSVEVPE
ncbi:restriction endonuclease subunit S [Vibrio vulnificus]